MYKTDFENACYEKTLKVLEDEKNKLETMTDAEKENYKLDTRKFNQIVLKCIERIYKDLG